MASRTDRQPCPQCGALNYAADDICVSCGYDLPPPGAPDRAAAALTPEPPASRESSVSQSSAARSPDRFSAVVVVPATILVVFCLAAGGYSGFRAGLAAVCAYVLPPGGEVHGEAAPHVTLGALFVILAHVAAGLALGLTVGVVAVAGRWPKWLVAACFVGVVWAVHVWSGGYLRRLEEEAERRRRRPAISSPIAANSDAAGGLPTVCLARAPSGPVPSLQRRSRAGGRQPAPTAIRPPRDARPYAGPRATPRPVRMSYG